MPVMVYHDRHLADAKCVKECQSKISISNYYLLLSPNLRWSTQGTRRIADANSHAKTKGKHPFPEHNSLGRSYWVRLYCLKSQDLDLACLLKLMTYDR